MTITVLGSVEAVTPDWLTDVLRREVEFSDIRVTEVAVERSRPTFVSLISRLRVTYAGMPPPKAPTRLFLKMTNEKWTGGRAGHTEVLFYRTIAPEIRGLPAPRCFDAVFDETTKRFHLLLEDLSESHREFTDTFLPPTVPECERIMEALARLHASRWEKHQLSTGQEDINEFVANLDKVFARFVDITGDRLSPERRRRCERMLAGRRVLARRLVTNKDLTLVHGDAHVGNMLYPREGSGDRVRFVDWEIWRTRPGAWDLAYLMAVHWFPERRRSFEDRLLQHYHRALEAEGMQGYGLEALCTDYRLALIDQLGVPLYQAEQKLPPWLWWSHFERIMLAYEDLGCEELLNGA